MINQNWIRIVVGITFASFSITACSTFSPQITKSSDKRLPSRSIAAETQAEKDARIALAQLASAQTGDPKAYTAAIDGLANHRFYEVTEAVTKILSFELARHPASNTFIMNSCLKTLAILGGESAQIIAVNDLFTNNLANLGSLKGGSYVTAEFQNTMKAMPRASAPPHLPAPATFKDWASSHSFKGLLAGTDKFVSDDVAMAVEKGTWVPVLGRDQETTAGLDVLVRLKGRVPTLMGEAGVGKTDIARAIAHRIVTGDLPPGIHATELEGAIVLVTSASKIGKLAKSNDDNSQAAAIEDYLGEAKAAGKAFGKPVIVFIDEAHTLSKGQINALKPLIEGDDPIRMILATTGKEMGTSLGEDEAIMRRIEPILIEELTPELTAEILRKSWVPVIEKRYNTRISESLLRSVIELAPDYRPNVRRPDGPIRLLQDLAIQEHRQAKGLLTNPVQKDLYNFLTKKLGLPVVVQDRPAFIAYMDKLKVEIKKEVIGQTEMIDQLVETFATGISRSGPRTHASVMILGTTGVGKTMGAEILGEKFYGSKNRILEIDMTAYMDGKFSTNALFGAPPGVISSDTNKGIIVEFLEGKGKGGGVIILNEMEKAHPDVFKRFMEMLDRGEVTGGDGRIRKLGRSLVVMTSNKGALKFFPKEIMKGITREELNRRTRLIDPAQLKDAFMQKSSYTQTEGVIPPEVVQRVDKWILATPLLPEDALLIAGNEVRKFKAEQLKLGIKVEVSEKFTNTLVESTFNEAEGAREVSRQVRTMLDKGTNNFVGKFGIADVITIDATSPPNNPTTSSVVVSGGKNRVTLEGPRVLIHNPMRDPVIRARLQNLEENLGKKVLDQEDAVKKVAQSVKNAAASPANKAPASVFLIGRTGTGKTEIAKALAESRYGNVNAISIIPMGEVGSKFELNNIFSPPKGIVGSDTKGKFEEILEMYPEGAVIVFDEMSNAGGKDKAMKEEIAKTFYSILDEGTWSSPSKTYTNLAKFTFIFTGNDGEQYFSGLTDDDLLLATWKGLTDDPEKIRNVLKESGFPEAFLGRIKSVVMMKPPSMASKVKIAEKLLNGWKKAFEEAQPIKVVLEEGLAKKISELMYSSNQGARSMRNFIDTTLGSLAAESLFDLDWSVLDHEKAEIQIAAESISPINPFYWLRPDHRQATLKITTTQGGKIVFDKTLDFTKEATFIKQIRKINALGTAIHEAGHAVMNIPRFSGQRLEHVTIRPSGDHLGYARYVPIPGHTTNHNRESLVRDVAVKIAGTEAELLVGIQRNTGVSGDLDQARKMIQKVALEGGLIPELDAAPLDKEGKVIMSSFVVDHLRNFSDGVMQEAKTLAATYMKENWNGMFAVARVLVQKTSISGDEFRAIMKAAAIEQKVKPGIAEKMYKFSVRLMASLSKDCKSLLRNEEDY